LSNFPVEPRRWIRLTCCVICCVGFSGCKQEREKSGREVIKSLPYLNWHPVPATQRNKVAVSHHVPERSFQGLTLYNSRPRGRAALIDMQGREVHAWTSKDPQDAWAVIALHDRHLYAIVEHAMLVKLDWDSRLVWRSRLPFHHEIAFDAEGDLYSLATLKGTLHRRGFEITFIDQEVVVIGPYGRIVNRLPLYKIIANTAPLRRQVQRLVDLELLRISVKLAARSAAGQQRARLRRLETSLNDLQIPRIFQQTPRTDVERESLLALGPGFETKHHSAIQAQLSELRLDLLHPNAVQPLGRDFGQLFRRADLLLTFRELDALVVIRPQTRQVLWWWGPSDLERPHHGTVVDDDNFLVFDNGTFSGRSRLVELNPVTKTIVWQWASGSKKELFLSGEMGACQRLPNGNTLVSESMRGRVFEIKRDGELVWEFFNPDVTKTHRAAIYRATRLPDYRAAARGSR